MLVLKVTDDSTVRWRMDFSPRAHWFVSLTLTLRLSLCCSNAWFYTDISWFFRVRKCLKYKTDQKADIRRMESLTMRLMDLMVSKKSDEELGLDAGAGKGDLP